MGVKAKSYQSNAADYDAQALVDQVLRSLRSLAVNNAGITIDNLVMRLGEADFDQVIQVNLKSVFNMIKPFSVPF